MLKKIITPVFLLLLSISCFSQGQLKSVFSDIEKLVEKAKGEKLSSFLGEKKISKQEFSYEKVSSYQKDQDKYGTEWVTRYTGIPWGNLFEHYIWAESSNEDVSKITLEFKKNFKREYFASDAQGDESPLRTDDLEIWCLTKDAKEMEKLITRLYELKEQRPESKFNEQIRKFSKSETIDWLKKNLSFTGSVITTDIKVVSVDECKIVVSYSSLYQYEDEYPTSIHAVNKYGKFEYEKEISSSRRKDLSSGKSYGKYSSLALRNTDEEFLENVSVALKHLASFCKR